MLASKVELESALNNREEEILILRKELLDTQLQRSDLHTRNQEVRLIYLRLR